MKTRLTSIGLSVAVLTCSAAANPPTVEQCKANIEAMVSRMNEGATDGPCRPNWKSLKTHEAQPE